MCGIVGIVGKSEVSDRILKSLFRLEYRGYDSAGIAVKSFNGFSVTKALGKINKLAAKLQTNPLKGKLGIGHTRWATHGSPSEVNAHPHTVGRVTIVHNGIIENHNELRQNLVAKGVTFLSETDSEVIAALINHFYDELNDPMNAVLAVRKELEGAFAVGVIFSDVDNFMIGIKRGAPLAIGLGDGEMYLGSDALALAPFTDKIIYLDDDEIVSLALNSFKILDIFDKEVTRTPKLISPDLDVAGKGDFDHFMLKEIYEQPRVVSNSFNHYFNKADQSFTLNELDINWNDVSRIYIIACGTSYHAGMVSKYWFETFAGIPVEVEIASEFRYRDVVLDKKALAIFISQSGETADTLAALKFCKEKNVRTLALVNVAESSISNLADYSLPIMAGYEIGVASTKAFSAQVLLLGMICLVASKNRNSITNEVYEREVFGLHELPDNISQVLELNEDVKTLAYSIADAKSMIYIGRGTSYAIALEGALKLKELSYIHAEGIASGELKHGSIALIDENMPVIVIAPSDKLFSKTASNVFEVYSRSGNVVAFTDKAGSEELSKLSDNILIIPKASEMSSPILYAIATQQLAYHVANSLGKDVDQPRNLAKSVTVE